MDRSMNEWLSYVFNACVLSIVASSLRLLNIIPSSLTGEFVHLAFVVVGGALTVAISHYVKKWLEARDKKD